MSAKILPFMLVLMLAFTEVRVEPPPEQSTVEAATTTEIVTSVENLQSAASQNILASILNNPLSLSQPNHIYEDESNPSNFAKVSPIYYVETENSDYKTEPLIKNPDQIFRSKVKFKEFGLRLNPKPTKTITKPNYYANNAIRGTHNLDEEAFKSPESVTYLPISTTKDSLLETPIVVADSYQKKVEDSSSDEVIVTPRPESKLLAHFQFNDFKTVTPKVVVQVQKAIPYYLGMYQYPEGYDAGDNGNNASRLEEMKQKAITDIELGKTLLIFPDGLPQAEKLAQTTTKPTEDNHVQANQKHVDVSSEELQELYTNIEENSVSEQEQETERPIENLVERPKQLFNQIVPQPINFQYLLEVPKYNRQQLFLPQKNQLLTNFMPRINHLATYVPQIRQYIPQKYIPPLQKLNLLVLPSVNIANLPPITKNPKDLVSTFSTQLGGNYRHPYIKHNQHYIGLLPPKQQLMNDVRKYRSARAHFDDSSIRMEYGFKPPMIPSIEIDEMGRPIEGKGN